MFSARIIDATEAMAVFALVRLCYPEIEMAAWRDHLARLAGKRSNAGCVVVSDQRGYAHASCLFRVTPDPRTRRRLEISYLSRAELPASTAPGVLFSFVDELARERECGHIVIEDTDARIAEDRIVAWTDIGRDLLTHDFRPGSVGFVKVVMPAERAS